MGDGGWVSPSPFVSAGSFDSAKGTRLLVVVLMIG